MPIFSCRCSVRPRSLPRFLNNATRRTVTAAALLFAALTGPAAHAEDLVRIQGSTTFASRVMNPYRLEIERRAEAHEGLRSEDIAETLLFIVSRPPNVTIRHRDILPQNQDI